MRAPAGANQHMQDELPPVWQASLLRNASRYTWSRAKADPAERAPLPAEDCLDLRRVADETFGDLPGKG